MWNFERVLGAIGYFLCSVVGGFKFGYAGVFLVFATFIVSCIYMSGKYAAYHNEDDEPEHDSCAGCKHDLGGGHCKVNLEDECAAGGGYEAWEEDEYD